MRIRNRREIELLIKCVKERPNLYRRDLMRLYDAKSHNASWEEIASILYPNVWNKLNDDEKAEKAHLVHRRWITLRAGFLKELSRRDDPTWYDNVSYKHRPYIYFDDLQFLRSEYACGLNDTYQDIDLPVNGDTTESHATKVNEAPLFEAGLVPKLPLEEPEVFRLELENTGPKSKDDLSLVRVPNNRTVTLDTNIEEVPLLQALPLLEPKRPFKEPEVIIKPEPVDVSPKNEAHSSNVALSSAPMSIRTVTLDTNRHQVPLFEAMPLLKSEPEVITPEPAHTNPTNEDDSTNFALSLIPMLDALPVHKRVEAQNAILSVIEKFHQNDDKLEGDVQLKKEMKIRCYAKKRKVNGTTTGVEIKSEVEEILGFI